MEDGSLIGTGVHCKNYKRANGIDGQLMVYKIKESIDGLGYIGEGRGREKKINT